MLLDIKERIRIADTAPTIQFRVDDQILKSFSSLAGYYKCRNAVTKSLNKNCLKRYEEVWNEQ